MTTINVYGAGARALAQKTNVPATCLATAWKAIGQGVTSARGFPTPSAIAEWDNTPGKVEGKLPPEAGYPGYWSGPAGYGDVCPYLGDDKWAGIDSKNGKYHKGTINVQTTAQRTAQVGGKYLGHSTEMLGHKLVYEAPVVQHIIIPKQPVLIRAGQSYKIGNYEFGVDSAGRTTVTVISTGHVHVEFKQGPGVNSKESVEGTYVENHVDGNVCGYYLDRKGKRHTVFSTGTARKAAGGQLELFAAGSLVIFNKKHVAVKQWG